MSNQITSGLLPIDDLALSVLVQAIVAVKTAAGESFTAYGITLELRKANPGLDIPHLDNLDNMGVREHVHAEMQFAATYEARIQSLNGRDAMMYSPKPTITVSAVQVVAQKAQSVIKQLAAKVGIDLDFDDNSF